MIKTTKRIKVIEANNPFVVSSSNPVAAKLKVCAYARVSTDEEDQQNSFENQIAEYEKRINDNPNWIFSGMYADRGISGTQIKKREQFKQMLNDARLKKFDLILTKSISRFGRNTVEILQTIRELRELNVTVFFEKENIYSDDSKLDFILTIMSSVAQEESRNISENIKWSVKKRFKEGKVILNTATFLGYTKDEKGNLVIVPEEAKVIKYIYNLFLQGHSAYDISKILMKEKIKTGAGKYKWTSTSVLRILTNEKYSGDAILQKTYTVDYLTHKSVPNDNIVDKYFVENSHEGIISKDQFNMVQEMIRKENQALIDTPKNSKYSLTNLVYCSICKRPMKRHIHNYGRKSEKVVLNCNHAPKNINIKCNQKVIENDLVLSALNDLVSNLVDKEKINSVIITKLKETINNEHLKSDLESLTLKNQQLVNELEDFVSKNINFVKENPDKFNETYLERKKEIAENNEEISKLNMIISNGIVNESRLEIINNFILNQINFKESILIKALFKLILVTPDNELIIVMHGDQYKASEILNDFILLNDANILIDKTHFDKVLNKNINYKAVLINE